jgi:para-aminobenzoate synthetase component 1
VEENPLLVLRDLLEKYRLKGSQKLPFPFLCGAVGYLAYDFGFALETIKRRNKIDAAVPDFHFGFYDWAVCVDHLQDEVIVFSSGFPESGPSRRLRARHRFDDVVKRLQTHERRVYDYPRLSFRVTESLCSNFSKEQYVAAVEEAKEYIARGDIYQVNLSQKFRARLNMDDWELYKRLIKRFPVGFSGFYKNENFSIISGSPECLLNYDGEVVSTRPMKGTRARTDDPVLNARLKRELQNSAKEKAELLMILDLERNDLGRVCEYGSVRVESLRVIEKYRSVFQATAQIAGLLHKNRDRIDLIRACFPGGSVTGAPKIRAMEVIETLEPEARSIYTGSLGFLSFHNTLEFNVLIRSFLKRDSEVIFNVGGGIVIDSEPSKEYEETLIKSRVLVEALFGERKHAL